MVSLPLYVANELELQALNSRLGMIETAFNALAGANLVAGTVSIDKLAKPKSVVAIACSSDRELTNANIPNLWPVTLPNLDGAHNDTWTYIGCSAGLEVVDAPPLGANARLDFRYQAGTAIHQIAIDGTVITASGKSVAAYPSAPVTLDSDDKFVVDYYAPAAGTGHGPFLVLFFSVEHVGT